MTRSKLAPLVLALSAALPAGVAAQSGGAASAICGSLMSFLQTR